jgi:hypothetical protein
VISSGIDGVYGAANALGQVVLTAGASLFAGNHGCGILRGGVSPFADITLEDCTIAMNSVCGVRAMGGQLTTLRNTIVARNGDDLDLATNATASFSDSGDGDLLGQPGCIAADPQFANTTGGDFRLRFGSPCAETGDPASSGASDLLGHVRPFDGNLDTLSSIDMGAFEFEPLHLLGTPTIGQQFGFEFWGPAGGFSALWLARAPLTTPQSTPFGDLYLDPGMLVNLGSIPVQPGRPYVVRRYVPNNPLLIGTTFSFQGLTDSAAAPLGSAYTNPISFVVLP